MAKRRVTAVVKIQLPAGKATPAPPVGTALGPHGVQTMEFVRQYNAATEDKAGQVIPVEITIFEDRSFSFFQPCRLAQQHRGRRRGWKKELRPPGARSSRPSPTRSWSR